MTGTPVRGAIIGGVIGLLFAASGSGSKLPPDFKPSVHFVEVQTDEQFDQLIRDGKPVLVDFWAEWCGPCQGLKPAMHALADEYAGRITVAGVDIDKIKETAKKYGVGSIPDVRLFRDGQQVEQIIGARAKQHYAGKIETCLNREGRTP